MSFVGRLGAFALAGTLVGLPLAATHAAGQQPGTQVTFKGGGLGVLLCGSKPDVSSIKVGAESKVQLTNNLGFNATLKIDGSASATVANGETVEVQFHRGPVSIGMVPDCALNLNGQFQQLTVQVTPAGAVPLPVRATRTPPQEPRTQPAPVGQPPADSAPNEPPAEAGELPFAALSAMPDEGLVPGPFTSPATVVSSKSAAARLASEMGPVDKGPIGLLAIIATVCVVGVSAGAIRAIITQRATRAEFA